MQGSISVAAWIPPAGTLGALTRAATERAHVVTASLSELKARARDLPAAMPFGASLRGERVGVIGEVKRASPSKGPIAPGLDAASQAALYVAGGARAISVLTEPDKFLGSLDDLADVARSVPVPVLRKDFLVHPVQLWEARVRGASAVLLIARALDPDTLTRMMDAVREAGLEALVEIRSEMELSRALAVDAQVIGVNNRDLETLIIDPTTATRIVPLIPGDRIAVAESGMRDVTDVASAAAAGADAVLVGSVISASDDPAALVRQLAGVPTIGRQRR